jgi:predicted Zn finger-like uncharacterized protein
MILTCPSCRTRYIVPDSAVGVDGRTVRCAQCRFSWFQEGPEPDPAAPPPAVRPPSRPAARPVAPPPQPAPEPVDEEPAYQVEVAEASAEEWRGSDYEPEEPPRRRRRNPAKLWTIAAVVAALLMVGALAAIYFIGPQQISAWMSGGDGPVADPLRFTRQSAAREPLPTDKELLTVTGEITNVSPEVQRVPQIRAEVTDAGGRTIYSTMVAPPVSELQPGQNVTFSFSSTDVPKGGSNVNLAFGRTG